MDVLIPVLICLGLAVLLTSHRAAPSQAPVIIQVVAPIDETPGVGCTPMIIVGLAVFILFLLFGVTL